MKKISITLLSFLITSMVSITFMPISASAMYIDDSETTWWTVEELLEFSKVKETEDEAMCGDDLDCKQELFFSHFEDEDGRYRALSTLEESQFWVTSINPEQETMKVLYFDEEPFLKMMGIKDPHPLDYIFIAWFNKINGAIGNYNHELPIEPQFPDDLHLLYANNSISFSKTGFPSNQPFSLPVNKTNLKENILGRLDIATFGEYYNSKGFIDYSSCLKEPDYSEGTECKLMFSAERGYKYLPPRNTIASNEENEINTGSDDSPTIASNDENEINTGSNNISVNPNSAEEDTKITTNGSGPEDNSTTSGETDAGRQISIRKDLSSSKEKSQIDNSYSSSQENNLEVKTNSTSLQKISNEDVTLPKAGKLESGCQRIVEFPWWLIILIIIGDIIILRFFWPKKIRKNP